MGNFRAIIAKKTDRRVRLLEEMITSMRIVKMYVWEGFFLSRLIDHRKAEMWKQRMKLSFYGFCDSILRSSRQRSSLRNNELTQDSSLFDGKRSKTASTFSLSSSQSTSQVQIYQTSRLPTYLPFQCLSKLSKTTYVLCS